MSAILLPNPPELPAGSVEEIVAAADALERAAAQRYRGLAQAMRRVGHEDVALVFDHLAGEEEQHVLNVQNLAGTLLGGMPTQAIVHWILPESFSAEEAGPMALLTPYKALSVAVRAEERAFAFWSYIAANSDSEAVRTLAESMAHQELVHAAKFRAARRKAYQAELRSHRPVEAAAQPLSLDALRREAAQLAAEAVGFLAAAAIRLDQLDDGESAALVRDIAVSMSGQAGSASPVSPAIAERLKSAPPAAILFEIEGVIEHVAERYIALLDRSPDARVIAELKRLADQALAPVQRLTARLAAVEPGLHELAAGTSKPDRSPA